MENVNNVENVENHENLAINGWNEQTDNTVLKWQEDLSENSFIYGEKLEGNEAKLKRALNIALIVGAIMALLTTVAGLLIIFLDVEKAPCNDPLSPEPSKEATILKWIIFSINLLLALGAFCITITQGLARNDNLEPTIKLLTKYIGKLDGLWAVFETELSISPDQRQNAPDFIKRQDGKYMHLMQEAPHMSTQEIICAKEAYIQKMKDHFIWQQKMDNELKEIKVE
jgi:hypothetical protein